MSENEFHKQEELKRQRLIHIELPNLIHKILHSAMFSAQYDKDIVNIYIEQIRKITNVECKSALIYLKKNTPVAGTTDVVKLKDIQIDAEELAKKINYELDESLGTRL